ncbi:hypothetical protein GIB67_012732 [Kingdonia uniflora]|uniref:F-box protein n=1 Tax=Kingdonia uniflora TaxID=39325 RepID=A0A7J7NF72_9MAGN|nr:hypothetical protein GIB67_012732 [Kingdonia uniflora]
MTNNTSGLISAVDIRYNDNLVFSKVHETETVTGWFRCSPFRVDLLDPKDVVPTTIRYQVTNMCQDLQENMTLSWIVVDQSCTGTGSACSNTSIPVSVQRHWLTSEIQVRFATILVGDRGGSTEFVQCGIIVTFGGSDMHVREVSLQVEDMDGINLNGKDSLVILQRAIESGERKKGRREEKKERYGEFLRMKRERKERNLRIEGRMDALCVAFGVSIFIAFWIFVMFKL